MWIGEVNIDLKNLSKNRREHYRKLKELFEKYYKDKMTAQDFLDTFDIEGKVTSEKLSEEREWIESEPPFDFGDTDEDTDDLDDTDEGLDALEDYNQAKEFVDALIQDLSSVNFGPKGNYLAQELADTLQYLANHYNYKAVYDAWNALPLEVQEGIFDGDIKARYKVLEGAASYIEGLTEAYYEPYYDEGWTE